MTHRTTPPHELLREYGHSQAEVRSALEREFSALNDAFLARQADWSQVQQGREWTPAQEAEHIILINEAGMKAVRLLCSERELRPIPQESGLLKDGTRQSPPFAVPGAGLTWDDLTAEAGRWNAHRAALTALAEQATDDSARTLWHPFLGQLGAHDWLRSLGAHMRHHRQLLQRGRA